MNLKSDIALIVVGLVIQCSVALLVAHFALGESARGCLIAFGLALQAVLGKMLQHRDKAAAERKRAAEAVRVIIL